MKSRKEFQTHIQIICLRVRCVPANEIQEGRNWKKDEEPGKRNVKMNVLNKKFSNNEVTRIEDNINSGAGYNKIYIHN